MPRQVFCPPCPLPSATFSSRTASGPPISTVPESGRPTTVPREAHTGKQCGAHTPIDLWSPLLCILDSKASQARVLRLCGRSTGKIRVEFLNFIAILLLACATETKAVPLSRWTKRKQRFRDHIRHSFTFTWHGAITLNTAFQMRLL